MSYKNIVVIDDVGDVFKPLKDVFRDDSEIKIKHTPSEAEFLKKYLKKETYLILINQSGLKTDLSQLIDFIQNNMYFIAIPIIIMSDDENFVRNPPKFDSFIINYLLKSVDILDLKSYVAYVVEILEYNRNVNDISYLPGSVSINSKIAYELSQNSKFGFVFLDLDKFKEFGEYFGLYKASQVMYFLANLIDESIKKYGSIDDFVGNVGGDDFILILKDHESADAICNDIIDKFNKKILEFYGKKDLDNGYIETVNRFGEVENIGIMGISIVSMDYTDFENKNFDEVFKKLNELKKQAKKVKGSVLLKN